MKLSEFRSNPDLVTYAAKLFAQPKFKALLEMLREEHPKNYVSPVVTEESASHKLGRIEGYDMFDANLLAAGVTSINQNQLPPPSFQPVQPDE